MVRSEEHEERLLRVAGLGELLDEERFSSAEARQANPLPLIECLSEAVRQATANEWLERLRAQEIPVSLVQRTEEMIDDEQAKINEVLIAPKGDDLAVPWVINHPVQVEGARTMGAFRPPGVG